MPHYTDGEVGREARRIMREPWANERKMVTLLRFLLKDEGRPPAPVEAEPAQPQRAPQAKRQGEARA